ncbi:MAG: NERD domain-containing protein [Methanolinea sp.]|jgi:uncharacterized protein YkwD|nr:NERD domain-containing protein [Methanolinea sp.]
MGIRFFQGQKIKYEHEFRQLREIVEILRKEYPKEPVYLLTGVLVANGQIDCVILTKNGPLILELKAFQGEITGMENGNWVAKTKDGAIPLPNLFLQAKIHRQDFIDRLIPTCREHFPQIGETNLRKTGSWLYFCKGSTYPEGQIDFRKVKWFRIVTGEDLIQKMRFMDTGYTLRIQDMDAIVEALRLEEYSFEDGAPLVPAARSRKRPLISRTTLIILVLIFGLFIVGIFIVFTVPGARVAAQNGLQGVTTLVGGWMHTVIQETVKANSTPDDSQQAIIYLNRLRIAEGALPIAYDSRAYSLALARAHDMADFQYLNYTNPETSSSALALKRWHGFRENETVLETLYGQWTGYTPGIERQAIDSWISDTGNRQRLFFAQSAGGMACVGGYCSYIGVRPAPVVVNATSNSTGNVSAA